MIYSQGAGTATRAAWPVTQVVSRCGDSPQNATRFDVSIVLFMKRYITATDSSARESAKVARFRLIVSLCRSAARSWRGTPSFAQGFSHQPGDRRSYLFR